ncbi:MAG: Lrp/AsnC family transcriptional regulator [Burkholderiales bacterium]|nr:Lrp/AsnC family transcriptional regulator [Burkholderiales bacterium]
MSAPTAPDPPDRLDAVDRALLRALQQDATLTTAQLADRVSLTPSPVARRVRLLHARGFIRATVALVDARRVGLALTVLVRVALERQTERLSVEFETAVSAMAEVVECWKVPGEFDYVLRVVVADMEAYERFYSGRLQRLACVRLVQSSFAMKRVKATTALPL